VSDDAWISVFFARKNYPNNRIRNPSQTYYLISETNGATGETLRDYVLLGLMPIAVIDTSGEAPEPIPSCTDVEKAALDQSIADLQT